MKNKIIIAISVLAVAIFGIIIISRSLSAKKPAKQMAKAEKKTLAQVAPVKKQLSKDMGGLTVKALNSKGKEVFLRIRAFRSSDSRSGVYAATFVSNRMQELLPGSYDIEIDTVPQKIYKNVKVINAKEVAEDLGMITGSMNIRALNAAKKDASFPVRIFLSKSAEPAATTATNKPVEIAPGIYDIEIGTTPKQTRKGVRVDRGKEATVDLGCTTGILLVKALDENGKEARYNIRITKAENNEMITAGATNHPIEIIEGVYNIEVQSRPVQTKKDLKINAGEEQSAEFIVPTPPAPAPRAPAQAPKKAVKR